ncbi:hypothetical protein [Geminocystis sp. NIES-3709]|uniref:hypothetical protein n=1 Tax=Geminocystis sp. NIES-3709 TaxID=1617448 RepID=UPI0005FC7776|nr:hypothetical protein [Geminocystis sp. NIES-3709]BAQ64551.1 hypothetical protein GM3709_1316 [Geminocystis sp. NIES-3709]
MGKNSKFLRELKRLEHKNYQSSSHDLSLSSIDSGKMSKTLENFMSPYLHLTTDLSSKKKLFTIGVVAWNASLYSEEEREDITNILFSKEVIGDDSTIQEELKEIVQELIDRKLTYFKDDQRLIIDFDLQKLGNSHQLSVTSQPI